jgi:hypothetical protein
MNILPYTLPHFTSVAWQGHPSFAFQPCFFVPMSALQEISEHLIEAFNMHFIALFYCLKASEQRKMGLQ